MKNLRYIYFAALGFTLMLSSACVKNSWSDLSRPELLPPSQYVTTLNMDFAEESKVDGQYLVMPSGWLNVGANGTHRAFQTSAIGKDYRNPNSDSVQCAAVTGYLCLGDAEAWLVTPPLKVSGAANVTFYYSLFAAFYQGSTFQLLAYSASSSSNNIPPLNQSLWTVVEDYTNAFSTYRNAFVNLQKNLTTYLEPGDDVVYMAFRYAHPYPGSGINNSTTWYIDNIRFNK